jgi:hypothetical protein
MDKLLRRTDPSTCVPLDCNLTCTCSGAEPSRAADSKRALAAARSTHHADADAQRSIDSDSDAYRCSMDLLLDAAHGLTLCQNVK